MRLRTALLAATILCLTACGGLQKKAVHISPGASKTDVREVMGEPVDTQFLGSNEAWQFCQTGAGFGYHDFRVVWFYEGRVTGVTSYRTDTPGRSCRADVRPVRWEDAPDVTIEVRDR